MQKISCVAQEYAWGKVGSESLVAKIKKCVFVDPIICFCRLCAIWSSLAGVLTIDFD